MTGSDSPLSDDDHFPRSGGLFQFMPTNWFRQEQHMKEYSEKAEWLAQQFHELYETLAPKFSYQTREASAVPWADVPEPNRSLMIAVAQGVLEKLDGSGTTIHTTDQPAL